MQVAEIKNADFSAYKTSRILYVIEAALEYFVSIAVGTTYLAKICTTIGMDDATIGILSSFLSLGQVFQIVAFLRAGKNTTRRRITLAHTVSQLFFTLLYAIPFFPGNTTGKTVLFAAFLFFAQVIHNVINPAKTHWYMSMVEDEKRGRFTATKEIVSLLGGMTFSFAMSMLIDHFEEKGDLHTAFVIVGVTLLVLTVSHTMTLLFSREKPATHTTGKGSPLALLKNKNLLKVIGVSALWAIANYATTPFYSTYQISELGFTMTFCSILTIVNSVVRACFSRPLGRFADKYHFSTLMTLCFIVEMVVFALRGFTVPANGTVMCILANVLSAIAMAGINSGLINLIYDHVEEEHRTGALALSHTVLGAFGFLTSLVAAIPLKYIQENGNTLFGLPIYAQQVLALFSCLMTAILVIYLRLVVCRIKK